MQRRHAREAQWDATILDFDSEDFRPFPFTDSLRILGVTVDEHFSLDEHFLYLLFMAQVRQGVLKLTYEAAICCFLRYCLTVTGS